MGVTILIVLLAAMDPMVSRTLKFSLLFGFLLVLYGVFLLCHLVLPKKLAHQLFASEEHEQRTLLIGPVDKAREMAKWIEETAAFGFGMRGSVTTDEEGEESRILHVTRVSDVAMLERIIRDEGIKQILLLEIPLDPEALSLVVNVANRAGVRLLIAANLNETCGRNVALFNLHNQTFIALRDEPLEDPVSRVLKRTVDLVFSIPVVIFVLPPLCLVVKNLSGDPISRSAVPETDLLRCREASVSQFQISDHAGRSRRGCFKAGARQMTCAFIRWGASYDRRVLIKYRNFSMCSSTYERCGSAALSGHAQSKIQRDHG